VPLSSRLLRTTFIALPIAGVLLLGLDLRREPSEQWSTRAALSAIHLYQDVASPRMSAVGVRCRFTPTCSRYAEAVIARDGAVRGGWLTVRRLARCGPWTPAGTLDAP
jgi:putative membrane protein insertion efficiency factor